MSDFHIENIKQVLTMLASVPADNLNLKCYRADDKSTPPTCGSVACVGGWLPWWPHFANLGVRSGWAGSPELEDSTAERLSDRLFGFVKTRCEYAFATRGHCVFDDDCPADATDHAAAIHRFTRMLAVAEAAQHQRDAIAGANSMQPDDQPADDLG